MLVLCFLAPTFVGSHIIAKRTFVFVFVGGCLWVRADTGGMYTVKQFRRFSQVVHGVRAQNVKVKIS
jgi:hypothetical protein